MPALTFTLSVLENKLLYLDPGSGSYLLQIILASILGGFFAIKVYWKKITGFFHRTNSKNQDNGIDLNDDDSSK